MKIIADTNLLVRAMVDDDAGQSRTARETLSDATLVAVTLLALCELVWVLDRRYHICRSDIARAVRRLIAADNVVIDRPAVEAGLGILEAGGDFADGVIAFTGNWLGGETFTSFDKKAVKIFEKTGISTHLLN